MEWQCCFPNVRWFPSKDNNSNLISAFFHMITITLISTSLVQLSWFQIIGGFCIPHVSAYTFFTFGYSETLKSNSYIYRHPEFDGTFTFDYVDDTYRCITPKLVNMMRIIILLCFMAIIFSLIGFFLDILGPKSKVYKFIHQNALPSTCAVLWISAIVCICYYIIYLIEDSVKDAYSNVLIEVNFEYGFYTVVAAGLSAVIGTTCTLLFTYIPSRSNMMDRRLLVNDWEDVEPFSMPPPPPYNLPPPPYTP